MRDLLVTLLAVDDTERALAVADECAAPIALERGQVVDVSAE